MNKTLQFTYNEVDYTLEFTRKTIKEMERKGFIANDLTDKPMTLIPALFAGAFLVNHRSTRQEVIEEILSKMTNKEELLGRLAEMYNDPVITLLEEPEKSKGNVDWTATW